LFAITPLNWAEWQAVLYLSAPVVILDEVLKFISVRAFLCSPQQWLKLDCQGTLIDPPAKIKIE
jgi:Ca2+ transporting ATPase